MGWWVFQPQSIPWYRQQGIPLTLQALWQPSRHEGKRQQGHGMSLARVLSHWGQMHNTTEAGNGPALSMTTARLTISWPISSSPLNTDMEMRVCKHSGLKSQPLANQKSNHSAPTQERPTYPKFPSSAVWFPKRQFWKIPRICPYSGVSKSWHCWLWGMHPATSGSQHSWSQHTASCCVDLCKITSCLCHCGSEADPGGEQSRNPQ